MLFRLNLIFNLNNILFKISLDIELTLRCMIELRITSNKDMHQEVEGEENKK